MFNCDVIPVSKKNGYSFFLASNVVSVTTIPTKKNNEEKEVGFLYEFHNLAKYDFAEFAIDALLQKVFWGGIVSDPV